jgi:predicted Zn-dependent protease with MMP-like domain
MNASVPEMIDLTEEQWNKLFDTADETVQKAIAELPEPVRVKAETWICWLEKYSPRSTSTQKVLGICGMSNQAIVIYVGDIFEVCQGNQERFVGEVRHVYFHELAHAIGNLREWEVQARGL